MLFGSDFDAGECRRDQRRLQTRTLSITYAKVRDKTVGVYRLVYGNVYGEVKVWEGTSHLGLKVGLKTQFAF